MTILASSACKSTVTGPLAARAFPYASFTLAERVKLGWTAALFLESSESFLFDELVKTTLFPKGFTLTPPLTCVVLVCLGESSYSFLLSGDMFDEIVEGWFKF